jgi:hypothetical protein
MKDFFDSGIVWSGPDWQALSAKEKQAIVWEEINREAMTSQSWPKGLEFESMFERSMLETFLIETD